MIVYLLRTVYENIFLFQRRMRHMALKLNLKLKTYRKNYLRTSSFPWHSVRNVIYFQSAVCFTKWIFFGWRALLFFGATHFMRASRKLAAIFTEAKRQIQCTTCFTPILIRVCFCLLIYYFEVPPNPNAAQSSAKCDARTHTHARTYATNQVDIFSRKNIHGREKCKMGDLRDQCSS